MNKILLFFLVITKLLSFDPLKYWWIDDTIYLKKDYLVIYYIDYENKRYTLKFRWTLFKNDGIVMLYNYEGFPFQNILYKDYQLNGFKKHIRYKNLPNDPYFMIYFENYDNGIAKFRFLIYNPKQNIRIKINEPRYRKKKWVKSLKPLYQKNFEREIK
jgi:hypothetical protein